MRRFHRSDSRKKNLKEAFDRMVRFHEDMINALTWLTSAESKVAELDSAVEATSTEEQQDTEALKKELKVSVLSLFYLKFRATIAPEINSERTYRTLYTIDPHCFPHLSSLPSSAMLIRSHVQLFRLSLSKFVEGPGLAFQCKG